MRPSNIAVEPFTEERALIARQAFADYGKGRHPAGINFGDCFSYALAKAAASLYSLRAITSARPMSLRLCRENLSLNCDTAIRSGPRSSIIELMQTLLVEAFGPLALALILLVAILGVRRFLHQLRNRLTPEQLKAARDTFRSRLVHPKPAEVEQGIGALLPQRLIALYDDHQTVLSEQIKIHIPSSYRNDAGNPNDSSAEKDGAEWIEAFLPLDLESQKFTVNLPSQGLGKGFCFATDGSGNFYWTPASKSRLPDAAVFFVCRDPAGNEQVAPSLDEFLSWPRTSHAPEAELSP